MSKCQPARPGLAHLTYLDTVGTGNVSRSLKKFCASWPPFGNGTFDPLLQGCYKSCNSCGGAVAQLGARLDGIEEVVGSNPIGSTSSGESDSPIQL